MPSREAMLDEVVMKISNATTHDVVQPTCCFLGCKKAAAFFVVLRYKDGSTDLYGTCKADLLKIKNQSPAHLEKTSRQGVFLYP